MFVGRKVLLAGLAAIVVSGCASTKLTEQWKEPTYAGAAFKKVLVIGATDSPTRRRTFETEFSMQLDKRANVDGVPSYSVLQTQGEVDREELDRIIQENGIDAVMITRLIGQEDNVTYTPGTVTAYPYGWYGGMYDYYYGAWGAASTPGYLSTTTTYRVETNVYAVSTQKLTWAGITETFAPSDFERAVDEYAAVVIKGMAQNGLL